MITVIPDAKSSLDHLGDPLCGPQIGAVAVRDGTLEKLSHELLLLSCVQPAGTSRSRLGFQCFLPSCSNGVPPAHHAARMTTDAPGYFMERELLLQQHQGFESPLFQCQGRSVWSHKGILLSGCPIILH
jgi:hypothetical protein